MKIINAQSGQLEIEKFEILTGESWCVVGSNRSGIRDFFDLTCGLGQDIKAEQLILNQRMGRISFKDQQHIYELEVKNDDSDYMDCQDPGTLGRQFIKNIDKYLELIEKLDMTECLEKGYRQMSTGQTRKLMFLSQISQGLSALAIQAPFEGLDSQSRRDINSALFFLSRQKVLILLFVHNPEDIPDWCSHLALVQDGQITLQGTQKETKAEIISQMALEKPDFDISVTDVFNKKKDMGISLSTHSQSDRIELVNLKNGSAGYQGKTVFEGLSLTVLKGDHTLISGPNGCGKSTLLHVITGDHPACYTNDLTVFNIRRGTGESIWDIKKKMGIVSPELHRNHYIPGSVRSCIISGLFDSIGIYRQVSPAQEDEAEIWLNYLGMPDKARMPFRDLTFADQRLVLIARALIKQPELLILDEPTQGLDAANRKALLDFLDEMSRKTDCTILYVSHREDEFRSFFVHHLKMG